MIWIVVQLIMIQKLTFLQPLFFSVGLGIVLLTLTPAMKRYAKPRAVHTPIKAQKLTVAR
jgi:hypothetical protein